MLNSIYKPVIWFALPTKCPGSIGKSSDKLKTFHLHYHNVQGNHTWLGGDLQWRAPSIKSYDPLIIWSCKVTWQIKCYISILTKPLATKHGKVAPYCEVPPPISSFNPFHQDNVCGRQTWWGPDKLQGAINLNDPLIMWPCEVMWEIQYFTSLFAHDLRAPN